MQQFKDKEQRLLTAINKVKGKLQSFALGTNKDKIEFWNNYHDLQYRLEQRLWNNWSNYHDWHFNQYGFNAYL